MPEPSDEREFDSTELFESPTESFQGDLAPSSAKSEADLPKAGEQFGHYRLSRVLGRGGMGVVYEAEDTRDSRRVALKLLTHRWDSPESRARFLREGRLAASINHPHSVYIYGAEEIDGISVISMEFVRGGTLQDRVRRSGPMPPTQAVDAVLQLIDGLEAAAAVGVMHRDIKPSNCFVDGDGVVKIGDFGLSVSETATGDSFATQAGVYLGTPAFSSPEQLRGEKLDIRSDIYAVGVTLYYLLTGRAPFEESNLVQLTAAVVEKRPPSPAEHAKGAPKGLCNVVLKCLSKRPGDRYADYAKLRAALTPFDSCAPSAATLALRFFAAVLDYAFIGLIFGAISFIWVRSGYDPAWHAFNSFFSLVYFALPECLWGATPGKQLCRLKIVGLDGQQPNPWRVVCRTSLFIAVPLVFSLPSIAVSAGSVSSIPRDGAVAAALSLITPFIFVVMFSTCRRVNGFAAVHDLATGIRVVSAKPVISHETRDQSSLPIPSDKDVIETVGPYQVVDSLRDLEGDELLLAFDTTLQRHVWIRRLRADAAPVPHERRVIGRPSRLRWLTGRRANSEAWDVYDAFEGHTLTALIRQPQSWSRVRVWLLDIATELLAAGNDQTRPSQLSLNRIWITSDGRAKLLDFDAPESKDQPANAAKPDSEMSEPDPWRFLRRVVVASLGGDSKRDSHDIGQVGDKLPASAFRTLDSLDKIGLAQAVDELKAQSAGLASVSHLRRLAMLGIVVAFPTFTTAMAAVSFRSILTMPQRSPEIVALRTTMLAKKSAEDEAKEAGATTNEAHVDKKVWEVYIAGRFRDIVSDKNRWNSFDALTISADDRKMIEQIVERNPSMSQEQVNDAAAAVQPYIKRHENVAQMSHGPRFWMMLIPGQFAITWLMFVATPSLVATLLVRRGLIPRVFGVEHVTRNGQLASRGRLLLRWLLTHAPVLGYLIILFATIDLPYVRPAVAVAPIVILIGLAFLRRSLPDRLSGTYAVPA